MDFLYIGQKKYGRHLLHVSSMLPSPITKTRLSLRAEGYNSTLSKRYNIEFKYWTSACSVHFCGKLRDSARNGCILEDWKKKRGFV